MKTLTVLWVLFCLVACGGESNPNSDPPKTCVGDQDCPSMNKCLENTCVDHPDCITDTECISKDPTFECVVGRCVSYFNSDTCYQNTCEGACTDCGELTSCIARTVNNKTTNICDSACEVLRETIVDVEVAACKEVLKTYPNCVWCLCPIDNGKKWDPGSMTCKVPNEGPTCTTDMCIQGKKSLSHPAPDGSILNYDWMYQNRLNQCKIHDVP